MEAIKEFFKEFKNMSKLWRRVILSLFIILIGLTVLLALGGCKCASGSYVKANYTYLKLSVPDLIKYIDNDKKLSPIDKKARIKAAQEILLLNERTFKEYVGKENQKKK
jgi:hypothetical protein